MKKSTVIRSCIIIGTLVLAAHCTKTHAQNIQDTSPDAGVSDSGYCVNYPDDAEHPHSKYDELIKYEDWTLDDLINFFQFAQTSESAGYTHVSTESSK